MSNFSFSKAEKLKSRKAISKLFENGRDVYSFPVKILYQSKENNQNSRYPVKCGVSVPGKKFRRAVDRNLLKRRIREAYRMNKSQLIDLAGEKNLELDLFILYTASEIKDFNVIREGVINSLEQIGVKISRQT